MICPDCKGTKKTLCLVDGQRYSGPAELACSRCRGTGEVDTARYRAVVGKSDCNRAKRLAPLAADQEGAGRFHTHRWRADGNSLALPRGVATPK